ncbi:hypothetical protein [Paracoccus everestensis]|uniref:hypothetical protein n=1 Tax=Paracoccus everestensis TaxID=2903900 RepID=UPI001F2F533D|nr:hypothetical protein [Paracoccus everestensis]
MIQKLLFNLPQIVRNEFYWTTINRSRRVSVAQVILFYPVVALLLQVATTFEVPLPGFARWVFFGMLMYSISLLIFYASCPGQIKRYDTAIDFANAEREHFQAMSALLRRMTRKSVDALSEGEEKSGVIRRFAAERPQLVLAGEARLNGNPPRFNGAQT